MTGMTFLAVVVIALVAGFAYNWIIPRVTPMLPSVVTGNKLLQTLATGVFIIVVIVVAHFVARAVLGKKATRAIAST
jgi:hypothetical protein